MKNRLKRRLQVRFVLLSVLALIVLQTAIVTFSICRSYRQMTLRADTIIKSLETVAEADDARYFKVTFDLEARSFDFDLEHTSLVTRPLATELAKKVIADKSEKGYIDGYRYLVRREAGIVKITFLSRIVATESFRSNARSLILIALSGIAVMAVLLTAISGAVVTPLVRNRQKQKEFITSASHGLKTPLTVINADAQLLESEIGENEWLTDIMKQTAEMTELTHRLVYLARAEEQDEKMKKIIFPISDVAEDVASSFRSVAENNGKRFDVSIDGGISYCGDEKAIRELLTVLLDNAFKYSPAGGSVRLTLSAEGHGVKISTENDAVGISEENIGKLSGRFYRADTSDKTKGFGIGLSIAKAVAENHKGKLSFELTKPDRIKITATLK